MNNKLRPEGFSTYLGQERVKENLKVVVTAARRSSLDHILLCGPPGTGKTSMARVIAAEMGLRVTHEIMGSRVTSPKDFDFLSELHYPHAIIFVDEIHAMPLKVEEALYEAMEDYTWEGKPIMKFTLIGATTKEGWLSKPMRDRFTVTETLELYTEEELETIVRRASSKLEFKIEDEAVKAIAVRSRGTPRVATQFLKRVSHYAENRYISKDIAENALNRLGVDSLGLDNTDREILKVMRDVFQNGPVGAQALATTMGEDKATIETTREPYLLKLGLISRGPRGRSLTEKGLQYLL